MPLLSTTQTNGSTISSLSPARSIVRSVILGFVVFIYTYLGAQTHTPPTLLPFQSGMLLILGGWWFWKCLRRQRLPRSPLTVPLLAALAAATLSTAYSVDQRISFEGLLTITGLVLCFFLICDLLAVGWQSQVFVDALLVFSTLILAQSLYALISWYWNWYAIRVPEYPTFLIPYRITEVAGHPNALAALINLGLPFGIIRLVNAQHTRGRIVWALWLLVADAILFFSRSRGGWIATCVVITLTIGWVLYEQIRRDHDWSARALLQRTWRTLLTTASYILIFLTFFFISKQTSTSAFTTNGSATGEDRFVFWGVAWRDFLAHPITGSGLATFGRVYMSTGNALRAWLPVHAHNLYFDTLAQQGLVGALALGCIVLTGVYTFLRSQQSHNPLLVCVCAALAGYLVHSLFDVITAMPSVALIVLLLAALGVHSVGALHQARAGMSRWALAALTAPAVLFIVFLRQNAGYEALIDGIVSAQRMDWTTTAQFMSRVTTLDPTLDFYYGQQGYAYGVLAAPVEGGDNARFLWPALTSYSTALRDESDYVPDLVNSAALLQQAGAQQKAQQLLRVAQTRGQDWALPTLLLATSNTTSPTEADKLFAEAFQREPQARQMAACRQSALCRAAAGQVPLASGDITLIFTQARTLVAQGQPQAALQLLNQIPATNADPQPWIDRADAHLAAHQLPQARYALRVAETLGAAGPATRARAVLVFAKLFLAQKQTASAVAVLERVAQPQIEGQAYSFFVFRRPGLPGLLLPRLDLLQRTADDLAVYRQLAQLYASQGQTTEAAWATAQGDALAALLQSDT